MSKEGHANQGVGVTYNKNVSVRKDKVSGHGDMQMSNTNSAFNKATKDTKKA
jgi:hypothetical protein